MRSRDKREKRKKAAGVVSVDRRLKEHNTGSERMAVKAPTGTNFFSPKKPTNYRLSIIPFTAGNGNPFAKKGQLYPERTYFSHRGIGPNGDSVVCNARTFKKPCYVCEQIAKMARDPDADKETEDLMSSLKPKERQMWNVYDHNDEDKGVQLWDVSFYLFGKYLDEKINRAEPAEKERYKRYADPRKGYILRIGANEKSMGKNKFLEFSDIEFKARKEPITTEILDAAMCLDDLVKEADYKEVKKLYNAAPEEDEEEEEETDDEDNDGDDSELDEDEDADAEEEDENGEEEDEGDEDSEDELDDEEDEEVEEDDEPPCAKGDRVLFKYRNKKLKGKVVKINLADGIVHIKQAGAEKPNYIEYEDIVKVL